MRKSYRSPTSGGQHAFQFWQKHDDHRADSRLTSWASTPRLNASSAVDADRGFVPSDVAADPKKKAFLTDLSKKIFSPDSKSKSLLQLHKRVTMVRSRT
jgi:hypothetical protein